jgi:hypothetical protein
MLTSEDHIYNSCARDISIVPFQFHLTVIIGIPQSVFFGAHPPGRQPQDLLGYFTPLVGLFQPLWGIITRRVILPAPGPAE